MRSALALVLLALAGCQPVPNDNGACPTPPPMPAEIVPKAVPTEATQTWQPGYVDWDGYRYNFMPGRWVIRNDASTQWMPGYWNRPTVPGPCVWVPAHWM